MSAPPMRERVLSHLDAGPTTVADVADGLRLGRKIVDARIRDLVRSGLVHRCGTRKPANGRPSIVYRSAMSKHIPLGRITGLRNPARNAELIAESVRSGIRAHGPLAVFLLHGRFDAVPAIEASDRIDARPSECVGVYTASATRDQILGDLREAQPWKGAA